MQKITGIYGCLLTNLPTLGLTFGKNCRSVGKFFKKTRSTTRMDIGSQSIFKYLIQITFILKTSPNPWRHCGWGKWAQM
jgi:hypothetical protein